LFDDLMVSLLFTNVIQGQSNNRLYLIMYRYV